MPYPIFDEKKLRKLVEAKVRKNIHWDSRVSDSDIIFINDESEDANEDYFQILLNSKEFKKIVKETREIFKKSPSELIDLTDI